MKNCPYLAAVSRILTEYAACPPWRRAALALRDCLQGQPRRLRGKVKVQARKLVGALANVLREMSSMSRSARLAAINLDRDLHGYIR